MSIKSKVMDHSQLKQYNDDLLASNKHFIPSTKLFYLFYIAKKSVLDIRICSPQ